MSEHLKKAARQVVDAWIVTGPDVVGHLTEKERLKGRWPSLGIALDRLAELLDTGWEYSIEERNVETGETKVGAYWYDDPAKLEEPLKRRRKYEEEMAGYGGGEVRNTFKIVKRRKPEGYVDA